MSRFYDECVQYNVLPDYNHICISISLPQFAEGIQYGYSLRGYRDTGIRWVRWEIYPVPNAGRWELDLFGDWDDPDFRFQWDFIVDLHRVADEEVDDDLYPEPGIRKNKRGRRSRKRLSRVV